MRDFRPQGVDWGKTLTALPVLAQLVIHGPQHPACVDGVKRRLQTARGVRSAVVGVAKEATTVVYDPEHTTVADLMTAFREGQSGCQN